ncbi:DUF3019 domain-containing protein [Thalassotalea sp. PLHSN55]|uniref:DUF3019 domain-containing protein n=1 Tax=Thalassotalea sp. PLHSN55 TaxID=3435888 RepID=UPI003F82C533
MLTKITSSVIFSLSVTCANASDINTLNFFKVTPSQCVLDTEQSACSVILNFDWSFNSYHSEICLYQEDIKLDCFDKNLVGYEVVALLNTDVNFYLKNALSGEQVAHTSVTMLKPSKLNLYNRYVPWRVF